MRDYLQEGMDLIKINRIDLAIPCFIKDIETRKDCDIDFVCYYRLALCYMKQKQYALAIDQARLSLGFNSDFAGSYYVYGYSRYAITDYKIAYVYLKTFVSIVASDDKSEILISTVNNANEILAQLEKYGEAV